MTHHDAPGWRDRERVRAAAECWHCGDPVPRGDADLHHLVSRNEGGEDTPDNLVKVHRDCHKEIHGVVSEGL